MKKTQKNRDGIEGLKFQISDQNEEISKQNKTISELENKKLVNENSWSNTKKVLIDEISKVLTEASKEEIVTNIERPHMIEYRTTQKPVVNDLIIHHHI